MVIDPSTWPNFRHAKEQLLRSLLHDSAHTQQFHQTIVLANRSAMRAQVQHAIDTISEACRELHAIESELASVRNQLAVRYRIAQEALSTARMLPEEIISLIISYTVQGPRDQQQILRLSHISRTWRAVVLSTSSLFTDANWSRWHISLIELWYSRAGSHRLTVDLQRTAVDKFARFPNRERVASLQKALSSRWSTIVFADNYVFYERDRRKSQERVRPWFQFPAASLREVSFWEQGIFPTCSPVFDIESDCVPALRVLKAAGLRPRFRGSPVGLKDVECNLLSWEDWRGWMELLANLPLLARLTVILHPCWDSSQSMQNVTLPSLTHLRLNRHHTNDTITPDMVLRSLSAPKLHSIELYSMRFRWDFSSFIRLSIAAHMPNIEVLSLDHTSIDTWSDIVQDSLATLVKGGDGSMLLPHLKELSLLSRRPTAPNTHDSEVSRTLRNLAIERRGTLTLLTMPPFHDHETLQILTANIERVTIQAVLVADIR